MTYFFYTVKKIKFKTVSLIPKRRFLYCIMVQKCVIYFIIKFLKEVFSMSYLLILILPYDI